MTNAAPGGAHDPRWIPRMPADELHLLSLAVARMEGKLDGALAMGSDHEARLRETERAIPDRLTPRLEAIERWRWLLTGAAAVAGGSAGTAAGAVAATLLKQ